MWLRDTSVLPRKVIWTDFFDDPGTGHAGEEAPAQVPLPAVVDDSINGKSEDANTIEFLHRVIDIDDDN